MRDVWCVYAVKCVGLFRPAGRPVARDVPGGWLPDVLPVRGCVLSVAGIAWAWCGDWWAPGFCPAVCALVRDCKNNFVNL